MQVGWYQEFLKISDITALPEVDFNLWMVVDTLAGFFGWAIFGNAWGGVKTGCRRLLQVLVVLTVCFIAHYLWSVCYPIMSIILALVMALVWVLRRVLRMIGMVFFHAQPSD